MAFSLTDYRHYLRGYAEARLGSYPEALRYHVQVICTDDDVALFTVVGHLSIPIVRQVGDVAVEWVCHQLDPILLDRKQIEDNWAPSILDEKLPAWVAVWDAHPLNKRRVTLDPVLHPVVQAIRNSKTAGVYRP